MKKLFYLVSVALLAFSCQKSELPVVESEHAFQFYFVSEKPCPEGDTKTSWQGSNVSWALNDQLRAGYYNETTKEWGTKAPSFKISKETEVADGVFRLESNIENMVEGNSYSFYSVFPSSAFEYKNNTWGTAPSMPITIPSEQALSSDTFDPKADVMVGRSTTAYTAVEYEKTVSGNTTSVDGIKSATAVGLRWKRMVAFSYITFTNLSMDLEKEKVQGITMTAQDGAALTGTINADLSTGDYAVGDVSNSVFVSGNVQLSTNSISVWFSTLPFEATELTFEIKTNAHTYTRKFENIDLKFLRNQKNNLTVSMPAAKVTVGDVESESWVATSVANIKTSDVVVYVGTLEGGESYALANDKGSNAAPTAVSVTVEDGKITSAVPDNVKWNVTYSDGTISFSPAGSTSMHLYCINNNNGVRVGTGTANTFTVKNGYLYNSGTSTARYVGIYATSPDWRCYTATTNIDKQTFAFYVLSSDGTSTNPETPVIATPTFDVEAGTYTEDKTVHISNYNTNYLYAYTTDGTAPVIDAELNVTSGTAYDNNAGIQITTSCTLKAIAVDEDGNASEVASVEYVINKPVGVAAPTFSLEAGTYTSAQTLTLTTTVEGGTIYYTTDNSDPSESSTAIEYTTSISITETTTIKAVVMDGDANFSEVVTRTFTISAEPVLKQTFSCSATSLTEGVYSYEADKATGANAPIMSGDVLRLYANNTLTVSTSGSSKITKIELVCSKNSSKAYAGMSADKGSFASGDTPSGSATATAVWTGSESSVVFTVGSTGQRQIVSILVYE